MECLLQNPHNDFERKSNELIVIMIENICENTEAQIALIDLVNHYRLELQKSRIRELEIIKKLQS